MLTTFRCALSPRIALSLACVLSALAGAAYALTADIPGSSDHPLVPRVPFAFIAHYKGPETGKYDVILGPLPSESATAADVKERQQLSGKVTRMQYSVVSQQSVSDVFYQYDYRIGNSGFETLAKTKGPLPLEPGGATWLSTVFASLEKDAVDGLVTSVAASQRRYYAGRLARPDGDLYLVMVYNQHTADEVRVQLDVIEVQ
jgi:hypothetical protein